MVISSQGLVFLDLSFAFVLYKLLEFEEVNFQFGILMIEKSKLVSNWWIFCFRTSFFKCIQIVRKVAKSNPIIQLYPLEDT